MNYPTKEEVLAAIERLQSLTDEKYCSIGIEALATDTGKVQINYRGYLHPSMVTSQCDSLDEAVAALCALCTPERQERKKAAAELRRQADALEAESP